jgi:hypothetical protein
MATDDRDDPRFRTDAAFERWLLDSAKVDAPSEGATARSWAQLTESLGAALPVESPRLALETTSAASGTALKWLAVGALGGAVVTATWLSGPGREAPPSLADQPALMVAPASDARTARATRPPAAATSTSELESAASDRAIASAERGPGGAAASENAAAPARKSRIRPEPRATAATAHRHSDRHSERTLRARRAGGEAAPGVESAVPAAQHDGPPSLALSTLEREVALLDAVRGALTANDFAGALSLIAQYRQQFEPGELARDADVFEVEAFVGQGERARAVRAARTFVRLYPRDPHATRLRALAERAAD